MKTAIVTRVLGACVLLAVGAFASQRGVAPRLANTLVPQADAQSQPLDDFQCYQSGTRFGTAPFVPIVDLEGIDAFGTWHHTVKKPTDLCNPANVDGHDPTAPSHVEHLESYQIKRLPGTNKFPKTLNQLVVNPTNALSRTNTTLRSSTSRKRPGAGRSPSSASAASSVRPLAATLIRAVTR